MRFRLFPVLLFLFSHVHAQWIPTSGPEGSYLDQMVQSGSVLIVSAGNGGVYRSVDNGNTWEQSNYGFPCNKRVTALAVDNGVVYAALQYSGVYRSEDAGASWTLVNPSDTFYSLYAIGGELYAGNANGGVQYSPDGGATWTDRSNGLNGEQISDFVAHNNVVYAAGTNLYKSSDKGLSWTLVPLTDSPPNGIDALTVNGDLLVAAGLGKVYLSTDDFVTFNALDLPASNASVSSLEVFNNTIYMTAANGRYFRSEDNGATWAIRQNPFTTSFVHDVHVLSGRTFMTTEEGVYISGDSGMTWVAGNEGISGLQITVLFKEGAYIYAGTGRQGLFRSNNGGATWESVSAGLDGFNATSIHGMVAQGTRLFLATGGGVYVSDNQGMSWSLSYDPGINNSVGAITSDNGRILVAINGVGTVLSVDGGSSWSKLPDAGLNTDTGYRALFLQGDTVVISDNDGAVYKSVDLGGSWVRVAMGSGFLMVLDLEYAEGVLYAATLQGVYKSEDLGGTWSLMGSSGYAFNTVVSDGALLYAAGDSGVYVADKTEKIWYSLCPGLGKLTVESLLLDGDILFAGTFAAGVWKRNAVKGSLPPEDGSTVGVASLKVCKSGGVTDLFEAAGISRSRPGTWSPALSDPNGMFDPEVDDPGVYTYTFDGGKCGCPDYRKIEVTIGDAVNAGKDSQAVFCKSDAPVRLLELMDGDPEQGGVWSPLLNSGTDLFDPATDLAGTYTYTVEQDGCASASANFTIVLNDEPYAGEDGAAEVCEDVSGFDLITALGGVPDEGGKWEPALASGSSVFDPKTDPPGTYTYIVGNGACSDSSEVEVKVSFLPGDIGPERTDVCRNGGPVNLLQRLGTDIPDTGYWEPALNGHEFDPEVHAPGTYTYILTNTCGTATLEIGVGLSDAYPFDDYQIRVAQFANRNRLEVTTGGDVPFEFSLDGTYYQESGVFDGLEGGTYTVMGREVNGCGVFEKEVLILDYPRFFTPNGDGFHETWGIEGVPADEYLLYIYDRYGKLLRVLDRADSRWDGYYNGQPMPVNDYWFRLQLADGRIVNGHFTLKR